MPLQRCSRLAWGRRRTEVPLALFVLTDHNGTNVIPAAVEAHVAGDSVVFVQPGHGVMHSVAVRPRFFYGADQHLRAVVAVSGIYIWSHSKSLLKSADKLGPQRVVLFWIKEVRCHHTFGGWASQLDKFRIHHAVEAEERRFHTRIAELR